MDNAFEIIRTTTAHPHFQHLVSCLDHELWNELNEDQATYDQYNKVPDIQTAVLLYVVGEPVACGCFKQYDNETVEIKRMFVQKAHRGKGFAKIILQTLEHWALDIGYRAAVLETSIHFDVAQSFYQSRGYSVIPSYGPYVGLPESICFAKELNYDVKLIQQYPIQ